MSSHFKPRNRASKELSRLTHASNRYACEALERRVLLALVVPALHSLPGASKDIFLDFDGNPAFNWDGTIVHGAGPDTTPIPAFTMDADANNFSALEVTTIQNIWAIAAEKFSPFNIDVTTQDPGNRTDGVTIQSIIGGSNGDWPHNPPGGGGVSHVGSFTNPGLVNTVFVWPVGLNWSDAANIAFGTNYIGSAISHEAGHSFGLGHQRTPVPGPPPSINEYYNGDATRSPIMGNSGNITGNDPSIRGIWWRTNMDGLQNSPDPIQDDLAIISSSANGFGYRPFDHYYSNPLSITLLSPDSNGQLSTGTGVIVRTSDVAPFEFQAIGTNGSFTINASVNGGMLSPYLGLVDAATLSNVSATTVETATSANLTTTSLSPGHHYYIEARSAGTYGDIGQYTISGILQNFAYLNGSTLHVIGFGDNANKIAITRNSTTYTVTDDIFGGTATETFAASQVSVIDVALGGGGDTLNYGGGDNSLMAFAGINMGGGNDTLTVDDSAHLPVTTYELFSDQIDRASSLLGAARYDASVENLKFFPGVGFNNVVNVYSTSAATSIQSSNTSIINIGNNGSVQGINGALSISNPAAHSGLNIDDSADPMGRNCLLSNTGLSSLSPVAISWNPNDINGVTVSGGPRGNIFRVTGAPPPFGGAQNTINAGANNDRVIMEFAQGTLTVNGQGGSDTLTVDDTFSAGFTYLIGDGSLTRTGLSVTYSNVETANLNCGDSADAVNFGNGYPVNNSGAVIDLDGGSGTNTLTMDSRLANAGFNDSYTITASSVVQAFTFGPLGSFTYSNFASLGIEADGGDNSFNILSSAAGTPIGINGNGGNDTFNVTATDGAGQASIRGQLLLTGGNGIDALVVNSTADPNGIGYTVDAGVVTPLGSAAIYYSVESLAINTGAGPELFIIAGTNTPTTLNTGAGADVINVAPQGQNLDTLPALLTVNGNSATTVNVNDQANFNSATQNLLNSTSLTRIGQTFVGGQPVFHIATLYYSGIGLLTLNTGAFGNIVNVEGTSAPVTVNPGPGTGIINVDETSATGPVTIGPGIAIEPVTVNNDNTGAATAIFAATQRIGGLTIGTGGVAVVASGGNKVLTTTDLSITGTGKLDLTDQDMIIRYNPRANPFVTVQSLVTSGYAAGAWTGAGINSSAAAANSARTTGIGYADNATLGRTSLDGQPVDATSILLRYTLDGDANLDRTVGFNDLVIVAQNYGTTGNTNFAKGDFNYDGKVDFSDLAILAQRYNTALPEQPTPASATVEPKSPKSIFSTAAAIKPIPAKPKLIRRPTKR
jgi:hypothetical protein